MPSDAPALPAPREVKIRVHDGVEIALALLEPSPYRYDNTILPANPHFPGRETGPIEFHLKHDHVDACTIAAPTRSIIRRHIPRRWCCR
jgi:hypothetical protein